MFFPYQRYLLDKNNDGVLKMEDLKTWLNVDSKDAKQIFENIDTDKNGQIDYTEWLTAANNWSQALTPDMIKDGFNVFDNNTDGEIDWKDLKESKFL